MGGITLEKGLSKKTSYIENFEIDYLCQGVGSRTRNVRLGGVERDGKDGLVKLLSVRSYLLNTSLGLQIPQADTTIMT